MKLLFFMCLFFASYAFTQEVRVYKIHQDTRVEITALCKAWDFESIEKDNVKLNSSVLWLGVGSYIVFVSSPVDYDRWNEYFDEVVLKGLVR